MFWMWSNLKQSKCWVYILNELGKKNTENGYLLGMIKIFKIGHLLGKNSQLMKGTVIRTS